MGGKSSKQKSKKLKAVKGEQNPKEHAESTENGAVAKGKTSQNEATEDEDKDQDRAEDTDKNESITTEPTEKIPDNVHSQQVTEAETLAVPTETTPVNVQITNGTNSVKPTGENEAETEAGDSSKEKNAEKVVANTEISEKSDQSEHEEKVSTPQESAAKDEANDEAENEEGACCSHTEGLHVICQKTESEQEEATEGTSASLPQIADTGAESGSADEVEKSQL